MEQSVDFSAKKRLDYLKKAYTKLRKEEFKEGICIVLGDIVYGAYSKAPWIGWTTLKNYFPEFKDLDQPSDRFKKDMSTSMQEYRKLIMLEAIEISKRNLAKDEFSDTERLDLYKQAYIELKKDNFETGICIILGKLKYTRFLDAPWTYWRDLKLYFPEFEELEEPNTFKDKQTKRKEYITNAILTLETKLNLKDDQKFMSY